MSKETFYSIKKAKKVLAAAHNLKWNFDTPMSPLQGLNINPDNKEIACQNCIGMCCISSKLTDLSINDQQVLLKGGMIWDAFITQDIAVTTEDRKVKPLTTIHNRGGKIIKDDEKRMKNAVKQTVAGGLNDNHATRQIIGACGFLTNNGQCVIFDQPERPNLCAVFEEGGEACRQRFVARGSPAAKKVQQILNESEALLCTTSNALMDTPRNTHQYDFIPLQNIRVTK